MQTRDLMAVTAAIALSLALNRLAPLDDFHSPVWLYGSISIFAWSMTISLAVLAIIDARGRRESLYCPGKLIVILQAATLPVRMAGEWGFLFSTRFAPADGVANFVWTTAMDPVVPLVAAASGWFALWAAGAMRAEEDWRGTAGRVLAGAWMILALARPLVLFPEILESWR